MRNLPGVGFTPVMIADENAGEFEESLIIAIRADPNFRHFTPLWMITIFSLVAQGLLWIPVSILLNIEDGSLMIIGVPVSLLVTGIITYHENERLEQYRSALPRRIRTAGLLKRLALDREEIGAIYDYVPFPWSLYLGHRPHGLRDSLRLLTCNLDWYLAEPKRYVNPYWVINLLGWVLFLSIQIALRIIPVSALHGEIMAYTFMVPLVAVIPGMYICFHYQGRRYFSARLLHDELISRIDGNCQDGAAEQ